METQKEETEQEKIERYINHWVGSSNRNFDTMLSNYKTKNYDWALYIGHLVLEKLFKAILVKRTQKSEVVHTHNLIKLALKCGIELTDEKVTILNTINSFCIEARYDDIKNAFYKLCTREFADEQIKIIKEQRQWLKDELAKNC